MSSLHRFLSYRADEQTNAGEIPTPVTAFCVGNNDAIQLILCFVISEDMLTDIIVS